MNELPGVGKNLQDHIDYVQSWRVPSNTETVDAYQRDDLLKLREIIHNAEHLWFNEWVEAGSKDEGSCCGGKGIEVWFLGPRKRAAKPSRIITCSWVQGNISAQRTVQSALAYLKAHGIKAEYTDGWMD